MIYIVNIFFSLLSLILVFNAPIEYSYTFCLLINVFFVIQNVLYFGLRKNKNLVGFQFLFMIAFYFTNFVYPVFYYPYNPHFSLFEYTFNEKIISYATAVAFMAYSFYMLGLLFMEKKWEEETFSLKPIDFEKFSKFFFRLTIVSFFLYLATGGHSALASEYSGGGDLIEKGISSYIYILFYVAIILLTIFIFKVQNNKNRIFYLFIACALMLFFVFLGSRTLPLALGVTLLVSYNNNQKKIPNVVFLSLIGFGALFLTFIMFARTVSFTDQAYLQSGLQRFEINSAWDLGMDLIINNRNLYTLIDFSNESSNTFGLTMLGGILSPIPFLQSFVCRFFEIPPDLIGSATFNTYLDFGAGSTFGLGTNVVSDVYLAFGVIGVVSFFLFFGWIVGKAEYYSKSNVYWNVVYFMFVSNSIFLCRSGYFDNLRPLIWALVITYLYNLRQSIKNKNTV